MISASEINKIFPDTGYLYLPVMKVVSSNLGGNQAILYGIHDKVGCIFCAGFVKKPRPVSVNRTLA